MDKAQKELIKTYFRKRKLSMNDPKFLYKKYEVDFGLDENLIDLDHANEKINTMNINALGWKIGNEPEMVDMYDIDFSRFDHYNLSVIIQNQPKLTYHNKLVEELIKYGLLTPTQLLKEKPEYIEYFKYRFNEFSADDISYILSIHPHLVEYFKDRFNKFDNREILGLLLQQPQLAKHFINKFDGFSDAHIRYLLSEQPQLAKYFINKFDGFGDDHIRHLLSDQPQLTKYFENYG